jgi:alpha-glucoside transport system permease protein
MGELIDTLITVVLVIAVVLAVFVGVNLLVDQAPKRFRVFATGMGALLGLVVGAVANSGGWFKGGSLWLVGGAVLGALLGAFVWARRPPPPDRIWRIPDRTRPVIFLAPALFFLTVTLVVPTIRTVYLSFRDKRSENSAGLDNYDWMFGDRSVFTLDGWRDMLSSRLFVGAVVVAAVTALAAVGWSRARRTDLDVTGPGPTLGFTLAGFLVVLAAVGALTGVVWNNVFWLLLVTGCATGLGLAVAVLADRAKGESVAKSLIFMPMAISFVGASVIWRFVFAFTPAEKDQIGLLNALWVGGGGEPQDWIRQVPWNNLFLIAIMIWIQTGFAMVVLSAAIKGVPGELLEAARVDGANEVQTFWRVTLPQIRTTIGVVVTTLMITVLKVFDIVQVMTGGNNDTDVIANRMFSEVFVNRDNGRGSALAVLLFVVVLPLMIVNVRRLQSEERA